MKKKIAILLVAAMALALSACSSEPKTIGGDVQNVQSKTDNQAQVENNGATTNAIPDTYTFTSKGVKFTADMVCEDVVKQLGDPVSYFEAASCAFDGLEKTYTYSGFEIGTYEDGEIDRIAMVLLTNDLVSTEEGVSIGEDVTKVESVYGTATESSDRMRSYEKNGVKLIFILNEDGKISSIQYSTTK